MGGNWPDRRAFWRWHFYAGVLCIPFVLWLSVTGSIYLFRTQIEAAIDAPYDHLTIAQRASPARQARAALDAVPGATFVAYEMPASPQAAARVLVARDGDVKRVYVHPETLQALKIVSEEQRFMRLIFHLHGELMMGNFGSALVELAACWAIVLIATGLVLWWPRGRGLGGVLYPRLGAGGRMFWRDLHGVTGFWVSACALFLLFTGLPWAKVWGDYFQEVRTITHTLDGPQDWTNGAGGDALHMHDHAAMAGAPAALAALDRLAPIVAELRLAPPVLITPPLMEHAWGVRSDAANRPLRTTLTLDGDTGAVLSRRDFGERHPIDQAVGYGVAAHEGQLFGAANLLLSLMTALGLIVLCVSAAWLWLTRRPPGVLGAPDFVALPRFSLAVAGGVGVLAVLFPLLGASQLAVLALEYGVLRRLPPARRWLGLA